MNHDILQATYENITSAFVENLTPRDAKIVAVQLLADSARIREHGTILSWSEFNENPSLLVNRLLAKIIVGQVDTQKLRHTSAESIAVMSIENSASYLASEVATEIERTFHLPKPPRIIRARKLPKGELPSPAMSARKLVVNVKPITAGGDSRTLVASSPDDDQVIQGIKTIFVVDDFKATQSTLNGGIQLAINMLSPYSDSHEIQIIPTAGLGKPDQIRYEETDSSKVDIWPSITGLDVHFGPDPTSGGAYIEVNGYGRIPMKRASADDFNGQK